MFMIFLRMAHEGGSTMHLIGHTWSYSEAVKAAKAKCEPFQDVLIVKHVALYEAEIKTKKRNPIWTDVSTVTKS